MSRTHVPGQGNDAIDESERGSASIEIVILAPAFLLLLAMLAMGGRIALAQQAVDAAASEAARAATLSRGTQDAENRAFGAARAAIDEDDLSCTEPVAVTVDTAAFQLAPGQSGTVGATVRCTVSLAGLDLPGIGDVTLTGSASSPLDTYREH